MHMILFEYAINKFFYLFNKPASFRNWFFKIVNLAEFLCVNIKVFPEAGFIT